MQLNQNVVSHQRFKGIRDFETPARHHANRGSASFRWYGTKHVSDAKAVCVPRWPNSVGNRSELVQLQLQSSLPATRKMLGVSSMNQFHESGMGADVSIPYAESMSSSGAEKYSTDPTGRKPRQAALHRLFSYVGEPYQAEPNTAKDLRIFARYFQE
ncbi:hypothetical protein K438DRAFT_1936446 [Mycena galopus ATCC 62051]|nr:hypothetical protein K438DRAFT_1936446 [Mycena galopus ATCC 62051]